MAHRVTLVPGDGIGPEVTDAACRVLDATGVTFEWERRLAGLAAVEDGGDPLPADVLSSIRTNRVALKGPLTTPIDSPYRSPNIELRRRLDLYAQVRPCKAYSGLGSARQQVDLIVIREVTEDLYAGIEFTKDSDVGREFRTWLYARTGVELPSQCGISVKPTSEGAARRIHDFAARYAIETGRRKITTVHKAAVMKATDGIFLEAARAEEVRHPELSFDDAAVDTLALRLVQRPEEYDVLVLPSLYGDIVSDLAAGLVGGVGAAPGANFGNELAVFEAAHGSAPKYAGLDLANPLGTILSGAMMLRHLGETVAAERVERAVAAVIAAGEWLAADVEMVRQAGGTKKLADSIVRAMDTGR